MHTGGFLKGPKRANLRQNAPNRAKSRHDRRGAGNSMAAGDARSHARLLLASAARDGGAPGLRGMSRRHGQGHPTAATPVPRPSEP